MNCRHRLLQPDYYRASRQHKTELEQPHKNETHHKLSDKQDPTSRPEIAHRAVPDLSYSDTKQRSNKEVSEASWELQELHP